MLSQPQWLSKGVEQGKGTQQHSPSVILHCYIAIFIHRLLQLANIFPVDFYVSVHER